MSDEYQRGLRDGMNASDDERIERLENAVRTMAWWLVAAQTGFGQRDAQGIEKILDAGAGEEQPLAERLRKLNT